MKRRAFVPMMGGPFFPAADGLGRGATCAKITIDPATDKSNTGSSSGTVSTT
jgi:hypothetical protein